MKSLFSLLLPLFFTITVYSQKGTIRGIVYDDTSGETILFGNVEIKDADMGTTTDLDGAYAMDIVPGTYTLVYSYLGYSDLTISDVVVSSSTVTVVDARLGLASEMIAEVTITAKQARNTEAALATIKRRSTNVLDGISAASFKKIGDSNAAAAIKRVPGVSVEGGKYVFVRGLGDRYTKSILNGTDVPGLDPDRNTLQMDIFPTNIIDNILVIKSFTADLPADFTGGIVNINTKDFPESKTSSISVSGGFNPDMHLNNDYRTYQGGSTDMLGFDDGRRTSPTSGSNDVLFPVDVFANSQNAAQYNNTLRGFDPNLAAIQGRSGMDFGLGYTLGNQINKPNVTLGYNVALSYKNTTDFYQNATYARYGFDNDLSVNDLDQREYQVGDVGENNVLLGGLAGFSLKTARSKYSLNVLHLQNGEKRAGFFKYVNTDQGANYEADQHNLEYSQRSVTNVLLAGTHSMGQRGQTKISWKVSPTLSSIEDPDIRFTRIRTDGSRPTIGTESGVPTRTWRYLNEMNLANKLDLTREYTLLGREAKLLTGVSYTLKERDYDLQDFKFTTGNIPVTTNPDELYQEANFFSLENPNGLAYAPGFLPTNTNNYNATTNTVGAYASNEFKPFEKLKAIVGLRAELFQQRYTGVNQAGDNFDQALVLDDFDFFPTVNVIYALTDKSNLRGSVTRTIARPSFKEASFAEIIDPVSGRTFIGGFFPDVNVSTNEVIWDGNLQSTDVVNADLRYEVYGDGGQNISVSTFYKGFKNPIEIVQYVQSPNNFQPRNVGDGQVLGAELEFSRQLGNETGIASRLTVTGNITVTQSTIEMSETEFKSRQDNARDGQEVSDSRPMAGQAPYLINTGLNYRQPGGRFDIGAFYNVQGRTLQFVGIADRPDIYSVPFHSLNVSLNYTLDNENKAKLGFKIDNLLRSKRESVFDAYQADDLLFTSLAPQTTYTLSLSYRLN